MNDCPDCSGAYPTYQLHSLPPLYFATYALNGQPDVDAAADDHFSTHTTIAQGIRTKLKRKVGTLLIKGTRNYGRVEERCDASAKRRSAATRKRIQEFREFVGLERKKKRSSKVKTRTKL
ncbi:hypothetical protein LTR08_004930 [Meristemomyces frigidus]|nr:hypothetical protein LTR08_004930 [Meristemomyces frigidus]